MAALTQHQKSLAIAKAMYGEENVHDCCDFDGNRYIKLDSLPFEKFDPYINAWHSQAVQDFFKVCTQYLRGTDFIQAWVGNELDDPIYTQNKDLKTVIADCAYLVVMENEK